MEYQWDTVTEEELKHLYYEEGMTDREIAERFGVSMGKVAYKRRKYGISIKNMVYQQFMDENSELYMVNRIAGLLSAAMDGSWLQLEQLFSYYRFFGGDWDAAEPDMGEMKLLMERLKKR